MLIEFNHASSPRFRFVLLEARKHASFKDLGRIYSVTLEPEPCYRLAQLLKGFRNKRVFVDSQELPWDEVFAYSNCYTLRCHAYDPVKYCQGDSRQCPAFNPWRCIHARMPLSNSAEWLCYGHFDLDGTFIFDKAKIRHYLLANTRNYRFCPAYHAEIMLKVLDAFPETANPNIDKNWTYAEYPQRELKAEISTGKEILSPAGVAPASTAAIDNIYEKILEKFY